MAFLTGKRFLITGVLSSRSIAYGIARACRAQGAEIALSYVGERFRERTVEFGRELGTELIFDCDVSQDAQIDALFANLAGHWPQFDGVICASSRSGCWRPPG